MKPIEDVFIEALALIDVGKVDDAVALLSELDTNRRRTTMIFLHAYILVVNLALAHDLVIKQARKLAKDRKTDASRYLAKDLAESLMRAKAGASDLVRDLAYALLRYHNVKQDVTDDIDPEMANYMIMTYDISRYSSLTEAMDNIQFVVQHLDRELDSEHFAVSSIVSQLDKAQEHVDEYARYLTHCIENSLSEFVDSVSSLDRVYTLFAETEPTSIDLLRHARFISTALEHLADSPRDNDYTLSGIRQEMPIMPNDQFDMLKRFLPE